ncbi:hypothetical protein GpartN1_g5297.t1 [Galdieria partita]|uniref:Uncharacterized protein n=1 Tax=Galdieria partita TaxID=83374 RepID=A0A9C7PZM3_9RHOD|nr:hypothetical protein GpartN1_g5297.t1 [Galdieria partita]
METTICALFTIFLSTVICCMIVLCHLVGLETEAVSSYRFPTNGTKVGYFIAANLLNSEDIFPQFSHEIVQLATMLGRTSHTFISIYENGSRDKTKKFLQLLSKMLTEKNIAYKIVCDSASFSNDIDSIKRLALVRDKALAPLFFLHSYNQLHKQTKIIFLNDIYLDSLEIYRLVKTRAENYDWVCGLDFYRGFYDRFVSRDIRGRIFSRWYPYIREEETKRLLIQQVPLPVRSCWNGAAVFSAQPVIQHNLTFSGSLNNQNDSRCGNPRSECHMLALSFRKYNYTRIWINPKILISYDSTHLKLQKLIHQHFRPFFGFFNDILMHWFQKPWLDDDDACPQLPMLCC